MHAQNRENALSEIIGFVLILALLMVIMSLYVVYVVPLQGREAEIHHMESVEGEMIHYKMAVDSLVISGTVDSDFATTFDLGSQSATRSSSSFYSIPVLSPLGSSGSVTINSTAHAGAITINADALQMTSGTGNTLPNVSVLYSRPAHLYRNISTGSSPPQALFGLNVANSAIPKSTGIRIDLFSVDDPAQRTIIQINATPRVDRVSTSRSNYQTDLLISVNKNGIDTFRNMIVAENITKGSTYRMDLWDPAYGIETSLTYPVSFSSVSYASWLSDASTNYGYVRAPLTGVLIPGATSYPHPLGSLEFRSGNAYWISQTYFYQLGGVFLEQDDGKTVILSPAITVTRGRNSIAIVRITDTAILGSGTVGGTTSVQVQSQISSPKRPFPLAQGIPNARAVTISIDTDPESAQMWNTTFSQMRTMWSEPPYNVPVAWISPPTVAGGRCTLTINGEPTISGFNIDLDVQQVPLLLSVQP
ncbi:MAG: hypothetical protein LUQ40_01420 [Methanomicrobiales archaeon]|nr:hypothetical protein [Methanomicrobiales archaeon]